MIQLNTIERTDSTSLDRKRQARAIDRKLRCPKRFDGLLDSIRRLKPAIDGTDSVALRTHVAQLRSFVRRGEPITSDRVLALGGAITSAAIEALLGKRLYDTQLAVGIILSHGAVAEMQTG